jgi:phosphatidylserine/phosphatidylglycerophosphate/cardiolipin synthase-like enzyme
MSKPHVRRASVVFVSAMICLVVLGAERREKEKERDRDRADDLQPPAAVEDGISIYFSPDGGCEAAIIDQIRKAKKTIDMQAFSFTNTDIANALAAAHDRGLKVRAIFDKDETGDHYSGATYVFHHNIATYTDGEHQIAHNKVIILDGQTVITGSFNFTKQAERSNAENLLVITGKRKLADAYEKNFEMHLGHSKPYTQKDIEAREAKEKERESDKRGH